MPTDLTQDVFVCSLADVSDDAQMRDAARALLMRWIAQPAAIAHEFYEVLAQRDGTAIMDAVTKLPLDPRDAINERVRFILNMAVMACLLDEVLDEFAAECEQLAGG